MFKIEKSDFIHYEVLGGIVMETLCLMPKSDHE